MQRLCYTQQQIQVSNRRSDCITFARETSRMLIISFFFSLDHRWLQLLQIKLSPICIGPTQWGAAMKRVCQIFPKKTTKNPYKIKNNHVRIQDLVKRGAPASEAESCRCSEAESCERSEHSAAGVQGPLKGPGSFGFLMLKYAFSHILETLFLLFLTSILTPKVDKNRALDFTSINLRHSDMLHLFFNL